MGAIGIYVVIIIGSIIGLWIIFYFIPVGLWFSALISGVRISLLQLILMRWRKVPPSIIARSMIEAHKAGLKDINRDQTGSSLPGWRTCGKSDSCPCLSQ